MYMSLGNRMQKKIHVFGHWPFSGQYICKLVGNQMFINYSQTIVHLKFCIIMLVVWVEHCGNYIHVCVYMYCSTKYLVWSVKLAYHSTCFLKYLYVVKAYFIQESVYMYMYKHVHAHVYMYMHVYACTCTCRYIHVLVHTYIHVHVNVHIYVCLCILIVTSFVHL